MPPGKDPTANDTHGDETQQPRNVALAVETAQVQLPADAMEFLRKEAASRNVTMGEMLRIALGTHKFLKEKVNSGAKVQVKEKSRTLDVTI